MDKNSHKILLILDLDETLIHATENIDDDEYDFKIFDYKIYKRPYLNEFLNYVNEYFLLAIWSSASDEYVQRIVEQIIPKNISLQFIWGRSRCTFRRNIQQDERGYYDVDYTNHYHYIKPLKKVKKKGFSLNKILIVDDSPHKSQNNFGNAIYPKEFTGDKNDNELRLLAKYLETLKDLENVRRIEKRDWQLQIK